MWADGTRICFLLGVKRLFPSMFFTIVNGELHSSRCYMNGSIWSWTGLEKSRAEISLTALSAQHGHSLTGQAILPAFRCLLKISVFFLNRCSHAKDVAQKLHNTLLPCRLSENANTWLEELGSFCASSHVEVVMTIKLQKRRNYTELDSSPGVWITNQGRIWTESSVFQYCLFVYFLTILFMWKM